MILPTEATLRGDYLFGLDLTDSDGNEFPASNFDQWIERAIAWCETQLQIKISPTQVSEDHDYDIDEYQNFCWLELYQYPVISVEKVAASYAGTKVMDFPPDWIQIYKNSGQLQLVPTNGSLSQVLLGKGSPTLLPLITNRLSAMPHLFQVEYTAGFAEGQIPADIVDLIAKKACIGLLNIFGDILLGAGIASQSISIDGLSESIGTTQSAENSAYSARIRQYEREIKADLPEIKSRFKGIRLMAV